MVSILQILPETGDKGVGMHPLGTPVLLEIVPVGLLPCCISATFTRRLQLLMSCSVYLTPCSLSE